jgi:hypothetical protein
MRAILSADRLTSARRNARMNQNRKARVLVVLHQQAPEMKSPGGGNHPAI